MPSTTDYEFGHIVLVPFPLGDPRPTRKRPAAVVSSPLYHAQFGNLVIMAVTTAPEAAPTQGLRVISWKEAGLVGPSVIGPVLATIEPRIVVRKLGQLQTDDRRNLELSLPALLGPRPAPG
jgi:mRNA interferase MazF